MNTEDNNVPSSSSSSPPQTTDSVETSQQWSYDVFLSFRGEDTRKSFVDHLYTTLHDKGIHVFRDDIELRRGTSITPELSNAIEKSRCAVVIFSKNYAESSWCVEELTKIVECKKRGQTLIPVFYSVDPSIVRKQKDSYEEAFAKHEENFKGETEKIQRWRDALKEAASISGYDIQHMEDGHESRCIRQIAVQILNKLGYTKPKIAENLVGIEPQVQNLISLLNTNSATDVRIIGIWGMGGIGKSTIARAVFDQLHEIFDGGCFLDNVREAASKFGLQALAEKLLSETLKETKDNLYSSTNLLMNRLSYKKVIVVLDDVDQDEQIENLLAGGHKGFGAGSRIIITTRNKQLLSAHGVDQVYEVSLLGTNESLMLFNKFAFKETQPMGPFEELALRVVKCAWGLPLALKVLGSFLHKREKEEWESELKRLEDIPHEDVIGKLKVSIDALNDLDKKILLDIACFFKGKRREPVIKKFHAFGFKPEIGVPVLVQRSLLSISDDDTFQMHDLVQETAWYMVRHGQTKENYSRLWIPDDICDVMSKKSGTEAIEAIILAYPQREKLNLGSQALKGMENLRLLKIRNAYFNKGPSYLPNELQWLNWHKFPSTSLPPDFEGDKLVGLKLSRGLISKLWTEDKSLENLKYLNLSYSDGLATTPDFSMMPNLEKLNLSNCKNLLGVHESLGTLTKLRYLNLSHCSKLKSLPHTIHLESLEKVLLWDCTRLGNFPQVIGLMPNLSELHLEGTAIKELPDSLINISGLVSINLSNCKSLESITYSICGLRCLRTLNLSGCSKLETLPETLGQLETLEEVLVDGTAITKLPSTISKMGNLKILSFSGCKNVKKKEPSFGVSSFKNFIKRSDGERKKPQAARPSLSGLRSLKKLDLSDSDLVDEIASDVWHLASLEELNLSRNNFVQFPSRISGLPGFKVLKLEECKSLEVLPDLPLSIAVIEANECPSLHSLGNLSPQHAFLRKVSFFSCFKLHQQSLKTGICAADLLLELLLQGHSIIYGRFSILIAGGKIPEWFDHQKMGGSISVQLPSERQDNIVGIALCFLLDSFIPNSRLGVTFKLISPDHREYTFESAPSAASKMGEVYETDHLWITYISFNVFKLLFPDFTAEDWNKVCGCLAIRIRQDPWMKVRRCGLKVVYKQDLSTLAAERAGINQHSKSKELVVYEGAGIETKDEGIKEDIAALMAGVTELNWDVDPIEQDSTQLMNLRKSVAYKIQKTLSFEC
ncbi:TMV resistance protein N-like isoform X3 [Lycium ferocissimum]|uniref:TMV resistance protein N-like isoform X3 n=1 Tax=Lycium ferocissimum TaxID=112874 RepID=UPI002814FC15|nr:TMV resistance protein N-like isoform X3 [Lycium ferocissimum]